MRKKGRRYKRAEAAMKKIHLTKYSSYSKGYIINTTKKHPNYFIAMLFDKWEQEWILFACSYISAYKNNDGWVRR